MWTVIRFCYSSGIHYIGSNLRLDPDQAVEACRIESVSDGRVWGTAPGIVRKAVEYRLVHDASYEQIIPIDLVIHPELIIKLCIYSRGQINVVLEAPHNIVGQR